MSIAKLIRDMQTAGAPMEAILIAIDAIEKAQNYQEETKRKARDRKRVSRDSHRTVTGQSQDMGRDSHSDKVSPLVPPLMVSPTTPSFNPPLIPPAKKLLGSRFALTQLPDDWKSFCLQKRPDLDPQETFDSFRDWWTAMPGAKGTKLDWQATWRNWVRNQKKEQQNGSRNFRNTAQPGKGKQALDAANELLAEMGIAAITG